MKNSPLKKKNSDGGEDVFFTNVNVVKEKAEELLWIKKNKQTKLKRHEY